MAERGAASIVAWVADSNARAWAFYRKQGFTATDETQALPSNPAESETLIRLMSAPDNGPFVPDTASIWVLQ